MGNLKLPYCKKPCSNCPFKKDTLEGWLGEDRMTEILKAKSFVCHKNTDLQCAGFMLIKGDESEFVTTAKMFGIDLNLKGKEKVFNSKQDCINYHK